MLNHSTIHRTLLRLGRCLFDFRLPTDKKTVQHVLFFFFFHLYCLHVPLIQTLPARDLAPEAFYFDKHIYKRTQLYLLHNQVDSNTQHIFFTHLDLSRCPLLQQKFATSTLISAPLKVVTIECIEHDVTCLNERVFIKTMNHLLTNCSQSTLLAMVCRLSLLVLNTS